MATKLLLDNGLTEDHYAYLGHAFAEALDAKLEYRPESTHALLQSLFPNMGLGGGMVQALAVRCARPALTREQVKAFLAGNFSKPLR